MKRSEDEEEEAAPPRVFGQLAGEKLVGVAVSLGICMSSE